MVEVLCIHFVTVSQYLHVPKCASYDNDDCTYLADYLQSRRQGKSTTTEEKPVCAMDILQGQFDFINENDIVQHDNENDNGDLCLTVYHEQMNDRDEIRFLDDGHLVHDVAGDETVITSCSSRSVRKQVNQTIAELEGSALYNGASWTICKVLASTNCSAYSSAFHHQSALMMS